MAEPESQAKEDMKAFECWKKKWGKKYRCDAGLEEHRFDSFQRNLRYKEKVVGASADSPTWMLLDEFGDMIPCEIAMVKYANVEPDDAISYYYTDSELEVTDTYGLGEIFPIGTKLEHATVQPVKCQSDCEKHTKEDEDEDVTVKRQKLGCHDQGGGCCSDCGNGT